MADDYEIDIEEHDIMENPTIRNMFPDLSVIKKENLKNCDNDFESTAFFKTHEGLFQDMKSNQQIEYEEHTICNSQCTKASDPASSCDDAEAPENKLLKCNKIILGSKPNKAAIDQTYFEIFFRPYQAKVVLQDIQSYLLECKRYCDTCGILFPESSVYENHLHLFHPQKYIPDNSQHKAVVKRSYHKCDVCTKMFTSTFMLGRHMQVSHNLGSVQQKHTEIRSDNEIENQKKRENNKSDLRNTCFHCKETFETQKSLIDHLYDILQTKKKTNEIIPVLKSVLFRCNKCDIHFVSSQLAANHCDHMEMLINWKCSICYRIFKNEDELSHERQHSVSNNFMIYNLEDLDINKILFKCSKCSGHFSENNFLHHFRDCGLKTSELPYCSTCNILIDGGLKVAHESEHKSTALSINQFTVIETEVISDNPVKTAVKGFNTKKNINQIVETIREVKVVLQRLDMDKLISQIRSGPQQNAQLDTSPKCQKTGSVKLSMSDNVCFKNDMLANKTNDKCNTKKKKSVKTINKGNDDEQSPKAHKPDNVVQTKPPTSKTEYTIDLGNLNQAYLYCEDCKSYIPKHGSVKHRQSRCTNLKKKTCRYCGLSLTLTSFRTHQKLHEKISDLKLNNFNFFNIYNGQRITPPIPEYPKCDICGVHFLSKTARNSHACSEEAYLTCHICTRKLSEAAFKLHMMFHHYTMKNNHAARSNRVQPKVYFNGKRFEKSPAENGIKLQKATQYSYDTPLQSNTLNNAEIIYTCRNCTVTVDTYDKVVEHCHGHYNSEQKETETEICNVCSLQIDKTYYPEHQNLHEMGKTFEILKFDSYHFPVENDMWVKHIFKSIPKEKVMEILSKSIYGFEGRIKMDVVQEGPHELTIYKCDQCKCYIEPTSMFKHADNSCFKLRKHPCTSCGLPFISSAARIDHEKVHNQPGIIWKSYRIVVFNRERDKQLNSSICFRKRYILYQCRNCDGIFDKHQSDTHQCNVSDLNKCPECHLLLNTKEFETHAAEHKEFDSFNYRNMKVILVGELKSADTRGEKALRSNFQGVIYDYKMYRCSKCQICIKNEKFIPKHSCYFGKPHSKCPKCDLYFSVSRLKTHLRSHERDPDFLRANMTIVAFDPNSWDQNKNTTAQLGTGDSELTDSNDDSDSDIVFKAEEKCNGYNGDSICDTKEVVEETAKVYKCACGLHFLNEDSITRHFGVCRSKVKVTKQKCPKCDLLFTANVLFTHLLAHHSNKSRRYKYQIIDKIN